MGKINSDAYWRKWRFESFWLITGKIMNDTKPPDTSCSLKLQCARIIKNLLNDALI